MGSALDHPIVRAALILTEAGALAAAIYGAVIAKETFDDARRLSAYQLLATPSAPTNAKWHAAATLLSMDNTVVAFDPGCGDNCDAIEDLDLVGPNSGGRFVGVHADGAWFSGGSIRSVQFDNGTMKEATFDATELIDVRFIAMDMKGAIFAQDRKDRNPTDNPIFAVGREDPPPASITKLDLEGDDISEGKVAIKILGTLFLEGSNISDTRFMGNGVPQGFDNYFIVGHRPLLNGTPIETLADYVCPTTMNPNEPTDTQCQIVKGGPSRY